MVNLVNLHLSQALTTPGANLLYGTHIFGHSNFNPASTTDLHDSIRGLGVSTSSWGNPLLDSCFNFHSSTQVFSTKMEEKVGMFVGLNGFDPTYNALMFNPQFDVPELRGDLSMEINHFNPAGTDRMDNLPPLPVPASTPPSVESSTLPIEPEILLPRRKRTREPEVNQANIIEGSRPRTKSRRALGKA
ncbi:hypothetical protein DFH09DRAFT_1091428 [Mycena vulgaris]|nr:hypothetical protein DFH09DRAFT_1091428 [Mycena vulgaris]